MIIFDVGQVNVITQKAYALALEPLTLHSMECPHCHHHSLIFHGVYSRGIKTPEGIVKLIIQRVLCRECHRTHALLPSSLIPYCRIDIPTAVIIIQAESPEEKKQILQDNPSLDESDIGRIVRKWKREWYERLQAFNILISPRLIELCILHHRRQFLQNHCRSPVGFCRTT